jgi:hypothetical protein
LRARFHPEQFWQDKEEAEMQKIARNLIVFIAFAMVSHFASAEGIGKVKVLSGEVAIERSGKTIPATLGTSVYQTDRIVTGKDGSIGLLFDDDTRLSAGPNSTLSLDQFNFDSTTNNGNFDVSMKKGTLSVISGKLTQKTPGSLKVKTPAAILAVRGTEFSAKVVAPSEQETQK